MSEKLEELDKRYISGIDPICSKSGSFGYSGPVLGRNRKETDEIGQWNDKSIEGFSYD